MNRALVSCAIAVLAALGAVPSHAASQDICVGSDYLQPPAPEEVCVPAQFDCVWCATLA